VFHYLRGYNGKSAPVHVHKSSWLSD
jgi:hypothetical protein